MDGFDFGVFGGQLTAVVVPVVVGALATALTLILVNVNKWVNANFTKTQSELLLNLAGDAVRAAQQYLGSAEGSEKKAWAVGFLGQMLTSMGIKALKPEVIEGLVESALKKYKDDNQIDWPALLEDAQAQAEEGQQTTPSVG